MSNVPVSLTIGQIILGIAVTIITTVGGAYVSIRVSETSSREKIVMLEEQNKERKLDIVILRSEVKELSTIQNEDMKEILRLLGEIREDVAGKANR